ncbi:hypothetical protein Pyn_17822 [Prunus yedoensis var. nudiflora]|uniref:Uncharacterized protein n=1 Tax=Prunus yedoensis var. nudiflora TaxID=2094558 RepID=A0A314V0E5_PRUYE|nr:hypothetical protein Pyn_17822 [Prunus yedoensis var. nudiflora]
MASQLHDGDEMPKVSMGGNDSKKGKEKIGWKNWLGRRSASKREGGGIVTGGDKNKGKEAKSGKDENKGKVAKSGKDENKGKVAKSSKASNKGKEVKGKEVKGEGNGEGDMHQKGQVGQMVQMGPMGNYPVGPEAQGMIGYGSPNHQWQYLNELPSQQDHAMDPYISLFNDENPNACAIM